MLGGFNMKMSLIRNYYAGSSLNKADGLNPKIYEYSKELFVYKLNDYLNDEEILLNLDKVIDKEKLFLDKPMRDINYQVMNVISAFIDRFIGGSADLAPSNKTNMSDKGDFSATNYAGRNLHFGVRELAMAAIGNGMALHGGLRPYVSTFFVFSDTIKRTDG